MTPSTNASTRTIGFSSAQAREWSGVNGHALRYWKGILRPIQGRDARSSRYSLDEILALAVIARATGKLKVPIQVFADHADAVFEAAASYAANATASSLLVISDAEVRFARPEQLPEQLPEIEVLAIVRMDMVLADVKARMTNPTPQPQPDLFDSAS